MKKGIKITAAALAVLASAGATCYYAVGDQSNTDSHAAVVEPRAVSAATNETRTASAEKAQKDETVYILSDASGNVTQTIVSDWLKNTGALKSIDDISDLTDIVNVKGTEAYTSDGSSVLWDAQGSDIYYRGTSTKQVPISMKVTYTMDGKEIQPEELAGKSGHVKIRYDYTNHEKQTTMVGDSVEELYVPYLISTVTALNSDKFENIQVSNGKILSDGSKVMVMGVAFPGLKESLALGDKVDIEIPDYFEIEADVTDFELETSITVASSEVFHELDIDADSTVDDLQASILQLSDASVELCDGTKSLYDGIQELSAGTGSLNDGINQLAAGVSELSTGAGNLASGASELSGNLNSLDQNMQTAKSGAEQLASGSAQLQAGVGSVSDGLARTKEGLTSLAGGLDTAAAALQTSIQYEQAIINQLLTAHPDYAQGAPASGNLNEADWLTFQSLYASVQYQQSVYNSLTTVPNEENETTIRKGVTALQAGNDSLIDGVTQLSDGIEQIHTGSLTLQDGLSKLADGSSRLNTGAATLSEGAEALAAGTGRLAGGASELLSGGRALASGTSQLEDGASRLQDGMNEFNETGIQKLSDAINGDFIRYLDRFQALKNLSADYGTFSGLADDMDGKVTFIYTTDNILAD